MRSSERPGQYASGTSPLYTYLPMPPATSIDAPVM
jgi:hypothetical protein